jgi:dihydroxyacetone kinase phosphoprotein-dependent L subunit
MIITKNTSIDITQASWVVRQLIDTINANRQYLSEVDGAIGDGDHGVNMSKGFTQCGVLLAERGLSTSLSIAFHDLSTALLEGVGGSMGPLYGSFFFAIGETLEGHNTLDKALFVKALDAGIEAVQSVGDVKLGDKTLVDTLIPARDAYRRALDQNNSFKACLGEMITGAEIGMNSTRPLRARLGRAARLGDRSIGVLDAGACSCFVILRSMGQSLIQMLDDSTSLS